MRTVCRVGDESTSHAPVICPKARAPHLALREMWNFPGEEVFKFLGPDWFLVLLDQLSLQQQSKSYFFSEERGTSEMM